MRPRTAACLLLLAAAGCGTARYRLAGEEAAAAAGFFARAGNVPYPIVASFSGVAEFREAAIPFVAGIRARAEGEESAGLYDPLGRAALLIERDGSGMRVSRGPAARETFPEEISRVPAGGLVVEAGPLSLGRVLSGAPGYRVGEGRSWRDRDGAWVFDDGVQTLYSDPSRRLLARAEYTVLGRRFRVSYPGRRTPGPPRLVMVETREGTITLRRDEE